jgi:iron-sulfur cluster repair protein YtfE (RIC family)
MSHCTCGCGHEAAPVAIRLPRITENTTVEEAKRRPGALGVLQRFGINHCCGAHLPLREAAAAAGVPVEDVARSTGRRQRSKVTP